MDHIIQTLKGLAGIGAVTIAGIVGYANMSHQVEDTRQIVQQHSQYIEKDLEATSRVDERTRVMKEQLDRIEQKVSN